MTSSIEQGSSGRFEEYITLRQEMLELLAFCRQTLYWTAVFVAGEVAWHMSNYPEKVTIGPRSFSFLLGGGLALAFLVYVLSLDQIYRVGSFLAVFWESKEPQRGLIWHRFNRRGQVGRGTVPDIGVAVMAVSSVFVGMLSTLYYFFPPSSHPGGIVDARDSLIGIGVGAGEAVIFWTSLVWWVEGRRLASERGWRAIKGSEGRQAEIHDYFEGKAAVIAEAGGQLDKRSLGTRLNEIAFAAALGVVTGFIYIVFLALWVIFPGGFQFIFNAQFLGADVASLFPQSLSMGTIIATLATSVVTAAVFAYVLAWVYNNLAKSGKLSLRVDGS